MADPVEKRYWDSGVFIAWIKGEEGRAQTCESIIQDAKAGRCLIYSSTLALAEVTKCQRGPVTPRDRATEDLIARFFRNEYIRLVPLDQAIGALARELIWEYTFLMPADAIHLATAIQADVPIFEHYNGRDFDRVVPVAAVRWKLPELRAPLWKGQEQLPL